MNPSKKTKKIGLIVRKDEETSINDPQYFYCSIFY